MTVPIRGPIGMLGELWIGRRSDAPFTERDRAFLVTLSGLAAIAITSAQMRENGRQRAVLAERERIAREMHDSLAQVLGVTHLRLRALDSREEVSGSPEIAVELAELADICEEAYQDVRESILGLRDSSKTERGLLDNLRAYLAKYSQQCKIETSLGQRPRPRAGPVAALRGPGDPGHPGGPDERPQALGSEVGDRPRSPSPTRRRPSSSRTTVTASTRVARRSTGTGSGSSPCVNGWRCSTVALPSTPRRGAERVSSQASPSDRIQGQLPSR